jgi:hypothetical protein
MMTNEENVRYDGQHHVLLLLLPPLLRDDEELMESHLPS